MADGETQTFASVDAFMEARREQKETAPVAKAREPAPEPEIEDKAPAPVEVQQDDEIEVADPATETLDEEPDEANLEGDEGDEGEPDVPAIAPPQFWDAKQKELFAKLPKEAQETVIALEKQRDAFVSRKANEAAQVARAAQAKQEQLSQHIEKLTGFVSETEAQLKRYEEINWALEIAEATTQKELQDIQWHQASYESLKQQLKDAASAQAEAQSTELREFHQEQRLKLKQIAPDLDPDKPEGIQKIQTVSRFLEANGIDAQTQAWMPGEGISLAYDALRWRQHIAKQGNAPAAQTPKPPAGPTVRPASSASGSSTNQRLQQLTNKKTLSQDEFIELGRLKRKVSKRK